MRNIPGIILVLILFCVPLKALEISTGFYAGPGMSGYAGRPDINATYSFALGFNIGAFVSLDIDRNWSIEGDLLWNVKNTTMDQKIYYGLSELTRTIEEQLTIVNFPVLIKYSILYERSSFGILAGISPQVIYERYYDTNYSDQNAWITGVGMFKRNKSSSVGLTGGVQYKQPLDKGFFLTRLMTDWIFMDDQETHFYNDVTYSLYTTSLMVGYQF